MSDIRYFKLHNTGAFVARMKVLYGGNEGADENGNVIHFESGEYEPSGYHDVLAGSERTIDLRDTGILSGAQVKLNVVVVAGADRTADEWYIYRKDAGDTAKYKISDTTSSPTLSLE